MYSTVIVFILLLVLLAKWLWSRRLLYRLSWEIPGPFGLPLIGSALQLAMKKIDNDKHDNLQFFVETANNYGPTSKIWLGSKIYILLSRREDIGTVLTSSKCPNRSDDIKPIQTMFNGDGLFTIDAPHSKRHRCIVSPYFSINSVKNYVPCFNKNALATVKELQDMTGTNIDIRSCIFTAVVRCIVESTMSRDPDSKFIQSMQELIPESEKLFGALSFKPWYQLSFIWNLSSYKKTVDRMKEQITEMANEKISRQNKEGSTNLNLLEKLIRESAENPEFTHENIRLEISTIISTAESTTITAAFALLLLAMYPEWQEIVFQEIETILPNNLSELTMSDLNKMTNVDMCVKEVLRLFPAVPMYSRNVDQTMKIGKYILPPGVGVLINCFQVNRNPDYWGIDSNDYNPKRFAPENVKNILPYSFLTFSEGPRNCFGSVYAQAIIKVFVVNIVKHYKLTTPLKYDKLKLYSLLLIKAVDPYLLQLQPRKN